jgi:hypothetical protein
VRDIDKGAWLVGEPLVCHVGGDADDLPKNVLVTPGAQAPADRVLRFASARGSGLYRTA